MHEHQSHYLSETNPDCSKHDQENLVSLLAFDIENATMTIKCMAKRSFPVDKNFLKNYLEWNDICPVPILKEEYGIFCTESKKIYNLFCPRGVIP